MSASPHNPSIRRVLLICMAVIAIIPLVLLTLHVYKAAWENSAREIREKHQLLAENLAQPISIYVNNHLNMLNHLAHRLESNAASQSVKNIGQILESTSRDIDGYLSITYIDTNGDVLAYTHKDRDAKFVKQIFVNESCYLRVRNTGKYFVSGVKPSPYTGKPTLFIGQPVRLAGRLRGVLLAELRIKLIESLRKNIKFGKKGHAAIVDQRGHVIAHPNPAWMKEMKDLSSWPIIQNMMAGKTGVTEFYSSFIKENMVAGYTAVPNIGWGIMVPQPKSEVAAQVDALMSANYAWGVAGLILAGLLAMLMASWITRSINQLARQSEVLLKKNFDGELKPLQGFVPQELSQLSAIFRTLVSGLQMSRNEIEVLNKSLQRRVNEATDKLQEANKQLEKTAQSDYLTKIANRRFFEEQLSATLSRRSGDASNLCIMLIDVDNFKHINDHYGHAAGDIVLTNIASILESFMRPGDLVARYGGDEFVTRLRCEPDIAMKRATHLRERVETTSISWHDKLISVTISVGVYCQEINTDMDVGTIMQQVDEAMYQSKRQGRNRVSQLKS